MRAHHRASALSARNVFCSGHSGGTENNVKSKCFYLKPLLLLFNERVITCMKTVAGKCCVCVQQSSCGIRWATGLSSGFLSVSKSFSTLGFVTGTYGIWQCKRGGEVGTGEIRVVRMGETQTFLLFEQPYRSHISVCIGGGYFSFMAI